MTKGHNNKIICLTDEAWFYVLKNNKIPLLKTYSFPSTSKR